MPCVSYLVDHSYVDELHSLNLACTKHISASLMYLISVMISRTNVASVGTAFKGTGSL